MILVKWMRVRSVCNPAKKGRVAGLGFGKSRITVWWDANRWESRVDPLSIELDPDHKDHNDKLLADSNRARKEARV